MTKKINRAEIANRAETHVIDPESGRLQQVVTPARLRKILRAQGESLSRPPDFRPYDEWFVED